MTNPSMYLLRYTEEALTNLKTMQKQDAKRVMDKLDYFIASPDPLYFAKPLTNFAEGEYRFRIGNYRVIFDLGKDGQVYILYILAIRHRKEAYK